MKKLLLIAAVLGVTITTGCAMTEPDLRADHSNADPSSSEHEAVEHEEDTIQLPDGFPQIVEISTLPEHMQNAFSKTGTGKAVAIAEGVWADLPPGATAEDAVQARVFSGFCASKEAFERDYLGGESTAGTCW